MLSIYRLVFPAASALRHIGVLAWISPSRRYFSSGFRRQIVIFAANRPFLQLE